MDWYSPSLIPYRVRTVRVGVHVTAMTLAVILAYTQLPGAGEVQLDRYLAVVGVAAAGAVVVARLPWERLLRSWIGDWALYAWMALDMILISLIVAFSGGAHSQMYVLYALTTVFIASCYPPRSQWWLVLFAIACYWATIALEGGGVGMAVMFLRTAMLGLLTYLSRYLAAEMMAQFSLAAARSAELSALAAELDRMRLIAEAQATHDALTGLLNREGVRRELDRLNALDGSHALLMGDVDDLKRINDLYGHAVGDQVLVAVGASLYQGATAVSRYGGDEFLAILENVSRREAEDYRDRVLSALRDANVRDPVSGNAILVDVSMGLAMFPEEAASVEAAIFRADEAMYAIKRQASAAEAVKPHRRDEAA